MADIREKIKKLLSLTESPNENEAKAALLKARELIAKNKMTEEDFKDEEKKEIRSVRCDDIKWTTDSGKTWMTDLCHLICENHCCASAWSTEYRTHTLVITGIGDDVDLCRDMVEYAVGFINGAVKILKRRMRDADKKSVEISYARGFVLGLDMAYDEQKEEHEEWGLVMVKPEEVKKYEDSLGSRSIKTHAVSHDAMAFMKGQNDGMNFNKTKVIGGAK